jgi:hypothetical protein
MRRRSPSVPAPSWSVQLELRPGRLSSVGSRSGQRGRSGVACSGTHKRISRTVPPGVRDPRVGRLCSPSNDAWCIPPIADSEGAGDAPRPD